MLARETFGNQALHANPKPHSIDMTMIEKLAHRAETPKCNQVSSPKNTSNWAKTITPDPSKNFVPRERFHWRAALSNRA
jgi:hypothetical protein